jgi:hypothetical protein
MIRTALFVTPALFVTAVMALATLAAPAWSQNRFTEDGTNAQISPNPDGSGGTMTLWGGFQPNPASMPVRVTGTVPSHAIYGAPQCPGWYGPAPTYPNMSVLWIASAQEMTITINSQADTIMIVRDENDQIYCDDNSGAGHNPLVRLTPDPAGADPSGRYVAGSYSVYIGTRTQGQTVQATVIVSEGPSQSGPATVVNTSGVDPSIPATQGQTWLVGGFRNYPHPFEVDVTAGGPHSAYLINPSCRGWIDTAPNVTIHRTEATAALIFDLAAQADTTLVILAPDGQWYCDDDSGAGNNPRLYMPFTVPGAHAVWFGTYAQNGSQPARLSISEAGRAPDVPDRPTSPIPGTGSSASATPPRSGYGSNGLPDTTAAIPIHEAVGVNPSAPGIYGSANLSRGFQPDPYTVHLQAGGPRNFGATISRCPGWVSVAPSFKVQYGGGGSLVISADSLLDTTLIVRGPRGVGYLCDDDDGTSGLNPSLTLDNAPAATYEIWVGTHRQTSGIATLQISERHSQ